MIKRRPRSVKLRPTLRSSRPLQAVALLCALITTSGFAEDALFSNGSRFSATSLEFLGFDEASLSAEARDGLREIYSGRMFYTAMPLSLSKAMEAAEAERMHELDYDPTSAKGKFYRKGSLPSPPNRDVEPGVSLGDVVFERDGVTLSGGNCFSCHAGVVNGTVVAGLGNHSVMQRPPRPEGSTGPDMMALAAALTPAEQRAVAEMMKTGYDLDAPAPERTSRGDNYGPFAVWAHGANLEDPANKGLMVSQDRTELADIIENNVTPPVNPMPWWLMKYKPLDYWYGDGNPYDAGHFSFNFTGSQDNANEVHATHVASTAKALAFARATVSPVFPGELDAQLVKKGADLFHDRTEPADNFGFRACYECHGTYTKIGSAPDYSRPGSWSVDYDGTELKNVNTDAAYNELVQILGPVNEHISRLEEYWEAQGTPELATIYTPLEGKGYLPPPLVGVWATAPYFHNGAVPTVEAVLNSKLRPEIWSRSQDPNAYDLDSMGMVFSTISRDELQDGDDKAATAPYLSRQSLDRMFVYDTTGFGRSNRGHRFGDSLTGEERLAIMEFLKSLSGPDMPSASPPKIPARLAQLEAR
jgi:hypothetical protein